MRTIYIHIGRGKTGTTTTQKYLAEQRAYLLDQGVQYVLADDGGWGCGHQNFAKSFITELPSYMVPPVEPEKVRQGVRDEIAASDAESFLITSENFPLANIGFVREWFGALPGGFALKIIFFARSQDELAESEYNQLVKLKQETRTLTQYCDESLEGCDFAEEADAWAAEFGAENILCRVCDSRAKNAVPEFLNCIGVVPPGPDAAAPVKKPAGDLNLSIGFKSLTAARVLNEIDIPDRVALYRQVFAQFAGNDLPPLLFDSEEARAFRQRFAASNRAFTERYMGEAREDLGGRRYTDAERDAIRARIKALRLDSA